MIAKIFPRQWSWIFFAVLGIARALSNDYENGSGSLKRRDASSTVRSTFLVITDSETASYSAYSGLNDYGIPYEVLLADGSVFALPTLNATATEGNYGGIVVSTYIGLSNEQWNKLYAYQVAFGVRLVRLNSSPSSATGTKQLGSCCAQGQEQTISINDTSAFPTAGLVKGATLTTVGLYHYPAAITNSKIATAFLQFGVASGFSSAGSVGGVINNISGRQQMVFFIEFATEWSSTSVILQHAWIQWATRGLYAGFRRVYFNTQVDDVFLISAMYSPSGAKFRIRPADLTAHISWMSTLNAKLPKGSNYTIELGHNGNGNIGNSYSISSSTCPAGPINYVAQPATELEFRKPLGTGINLWPAGSSTGGYPYSLACAQVDSLETFFSVASNRDAFSHVSHTFTHENENNATYFDVAREISWNQAWFAQTGLASAKRFSPKGLIPPAITGLHNGDALRAWNDAGIVNAVGDNTRPVLANTENEHWPLITTAESDGFAGIRVMPRWASNIYFNCDTTACDVKQWNDNYDNTGTLASLLALEKQRNSQHLLALRHDSFMFHQANMRQTDVESTTVNGVSGQFSLLQMWVETVTAEFTRVATWPLVSLKHDDLANTFVARMTRDQCNYVLTYAQDTAAGTITAVTVSAAGNTCNALIPVTVPGTIVNQQSFRSEKIGNDPLTIWVKLSGQPVVLTLSTPVSL